MRPTCSHSCMYDERPSTIDSDARGKRRRNSRTTGAVMRRASVGGSPTTTWPDRRALDLVDLGARALDLLQDAARVREQPLARLGRTRAATVAHEQILPQLDFEAAHLAADRRLGDAEQARRAAEAAEVDDGDEVFELLQVHARR